MRLLHDDFREGTSKGKIKPKKHPMKPKLMILEGLKDYFKIGVIIFRNYTVDFHYKKMK